jgi:hypothetical protein
MSIDFDLSAFFVGLYNKGEYNPLRYLIESNVPKSVMKRVYEIMVIDGLLMPIENIGTEIKIELVNECRATGIFFTNERLIDAAKILHTIKFINENT